MPTSERMLPASLGDLPPTALLAAEQVGAFLGCSGRTIQRAGIPFLRIRPRVRRYFVRDVLAWLEAQRNGARKGKAPGRARQGRAA